MLMGKTALVTGAAQGIGLGIVKELLQHGANVLATDLNEEKLSKEVVELQKDYPHIKGIKCDVTKEEQIEKVVAETVKTFGSIDILINNAGIQHVSSIEDFPSDKFELMIKIMQIAPFYAIKHTFPHMKKQKYGRILNMASINGLIGFAGKAAYNSAKHGVIGLTKVAALEGAEAGITVNALCPGYVDTPLVRNQLTDLAKTRGVTKEKVMEDVIYPLVPQKRLLQIEEISNYAAFLVSEQAKGITGQAVVIDGGYTTQ
ncbi:3-hydroxybutyrate dehydrogenase [Salirhabdus euzebyi]|uniref:3-hydroxybutyrate dehydrogenase n=1 Tax=Salirhabdus euzebyi TaxID=394506 RepID=A0A841Q1R3_9BACI|nr:3-hydroxybutyrate dehydrogenase [Salirhabdus euzebyi]MBB6451835.1 3-hydroxybutyrate dehydrogenase [Salirhabdus euzebyi]